MEMVISYEESEHLQALLFPLQAQWHIQSLEAMVPSKLSSKQAGLQMTPLAVLQTSISMRKHGANRGRWQEEGSKDYKEKVSRRLLENKKINA